MSRLAVFGYGSLASPASAALSLGREVEIAGLARLAGLAPALDRRSATTTPARRRSRSSTARSRRYVVGLNIEREPGLRGPNGVLIEITEDEADRLDLREMRYDRVDVTADVAGRTSTG